VKDKKIDTNSQLIFFRMRGLKREFSGACP